MRRLVTARRAFLSVYVLAELFLVWAAVVAGGWVFLDAIVGAVAVAVIIRVVE